MKSNYPGNSVQKPQVSQSSPSAFNASGSFYQYPPQQGPQTINNVPPAHSFATKGSVYTPLNQPPQGTLYPPIVPQPPPYQPQFQPPPYQPQLQPQPQQLPTIQVQNVSGQQNVKESAVQAQPFFTPYPISQPPPPQPPQPQPQPQPPPYQPQLQPQMIPVVIHQVSPVVHVVNELPFGTVFDIPTRWELSKNCCCHGGETKVKDQFGRDIFLVRCEKCHWPFKLRIIDLRVGEEIVFVDGVYRIGLPHFKIFLRGQHVATIKFRLSIFEKKIDIDFHNGQPTLTAKGSIFDYDFTISRGNQVVATVSKRGHHCQDPFVLEVKPKEDVALLLAFVATIDTITHSKG